MIKVVNLEKRVSENRIIIRDFNLKIERGERVLISGKSGSGKTTLLKILAMLDSYDSGEFYYNGNLVKGTHDRLNARIRKYEIGYIPQNLNLIEDISAYENIMLSLRMQKNIMNASDKICEISGCLGIKDVLGATTKLLSRGEQQRVAIARACVKKSKIIIADEPTASLDEQGRDKVMRVLKNLNDLGTTIILSSHDRRDVSFATKVVELEK
nr:ATP-binding cassette domain-containing protein [Eubacterium sp.]